MFEIDSNKIITLVKGDALSFSLFVNAGTRMEPVRYCFDEEDIVELYLTFPGDNIEKYYYKQIYTYKDLNKNGDMIITLSAEDTNKLPLGVSYYTFKLVKGNIIKTISSKNKLIVVRKAR